MTLTEFLLARIAEDEALARRCAGMRAADPEVGADTYGLVITDSGGSGETIIAADPARVLAECEAKRRIVATMQEAVDAANDPDTIELSAYTQGDLLKLLALPYADHADYREEWRP